MATATWQDVDRWLSGENDGLWSALYLAAEAFRYASEHRERYEGFFEPDGSLKGPGFEPEMAESLPEHLR